MNIFQEVFAEVSKKHSQESKENSQKAANYTLSSAKKEQQNSDKKKTINLPSEPKVIEEPVVENKASPIQSQQKQQKIPKVSKNKVNSPPKQETEINKEIDETEKRINDKKDQLSQLDFEIMNSLNELKELKEVLKNEKETTKSLKKENAQLVSKKQSVDEESKKYSKEIMEIMMDNKEELQKHEEIWEYRYNELLCQQDTAADRQ